MLIGSVEIDCNDLEKMSAFWQGTLNYVPREPSDDDWVVLRDPKSRGVSVSLQQVPEERSGKNRLHFDLYTEDQEGEEKRFRPVEKGQFSTVVDTRSAKAERLNQMRTSSSSKTRNETSSA